MALRPEELDRIKFELGTSLLRNGSEPYLAFYAIYDRVIQPFLFDNATTSATAVAAPGVAAITLTANPLAPNLSGPTFQVGTACVIDVGPLQETAVIQLLSGLVATLTFVYAHTSAPYYVGPFGTEAIVRDILSRLDVLRDQLRTIAPTTAGVSQVDDIRLYGGGGKGASKYGELVMQRDLARDDLGDAIGLPMGAFKESMKQLADNLRALAGPASFDVIADQLTIRTRVWTNGYRGPLTDPRVDTDLVIPQIYKIQQVSTEEIVSSGGKYEQGDIKIGPITPNYVTSTGTGGFTPLQLNPNGADGTEIIYVIAGTHGGNYQLVEEQSWKRFSYFLVLRRRYETP